MPPSRGDTPRRAALGALLHALAVETSRAASPEEALRACLERLCAHGGWRMGRVLMFQPGGFAPAGSLWRVDPQDRVHYAEFIETSESYDYADARGVFAGAMLRAKRPVWLEDTSQLPPYGRLPLLRRRGIRSAFGFPVVSGGQVAALLELFSDEARATDALLLESVEEIAAQLARLIERSRAHAALAERERQLRLVAESIPAMIAYFDRDLRCRFANAAYCAFHRVEPGRILGMRLEEITGSDVYQVLVPAITQVRRGVPHTTRRVHRTPEGVLRHVEIRRVIDAAEDGTFRGYYALLLDITEQVQNEERIRQSEARLRAILDSEPECVKVVSADGTLVEMNRAGLAMLEADSLEQARAHGVLNFVAPEHREPFMRTFAQTLEGREGRLEFEVIGLRGTRRWLESHTTPIQLPGAGAAGALAVTRDVTERKRAEEQVAYLSQHDPLTGLPNRSVFGDRLQVALAHARRRGEVLGVVLMGLDRFGEVNDSLGVGAGDELLRLVARRLATGLREVDTIARLGGDEFGVLVEGVDEAEAAMRVADRLLAALAQPFDVFGREVFVSASVGVAVFPAGSSANAVLENAGIAMRHAKAEGGGAAQLFVDKPEGQRAGRLQLESLLRHALERGELEVHYQPRIDLRTRAVVGAEALMRWRNAELGAVSPTEFIPVAEESGLIVPLGAWALRQACAQAAAWAARGRELRVSVNLSPRQFRQRDLAQQVTRVLADTGLAAARLELEITEGTAMSNGAQAMEILAALDALGVRVALDDFGTGYSSLAYLRRFPIHCLKIDRSFVHEIGRGQGRTAIVRATVALAHNLRMRVVAEGIESRRQHALLARMGCDEGQGFLYSPALPAAEFSDFLEKAPRRAAPRRRRARPRSR